jgi:hypothetical protein
VGIDGVRNEGAVDELHPTIGHCEVRDLPVLPGAMDVTPHRERGHCLDCRGGHGSRGQQTQEEATSHALDSTPKLPAVSPMR